MARDGEFQNILKLTGCSMLYSDGPWVLSNGSLFVRSGSWKEDPVVICSAVVEDRFDEGCKCLTNGLVSNPNTYR